jgi:hypothetical protein
MCVVNNMRDTRIVLLVVARCHDVSTGRHSPYVAHKSNSGLMRFVISAKEGGHPRDLHRDIEQVV